MIGLKSSAVALFAGVLAVLSIGACSSAPEQPILYQFFTASRLGDDTSLHSFAVVSLDPQREGAVNGFSISSVSAERTEPLKLKALGEMRDQVNAEDAEFTKGKVAYQTENLDAIKRVLKAENEKAALKGKDADVQVAWTKYREQTTQMARKVAEARGKLASESGIVQLSLASPGAAAVDPTKFDGDMVSKDVTVSASMKLPSGASAQKPLVVTMQRAVLKGDKPITGHWIITAVKDPSAPADVKAP